APRLPRRVLRRGRAWLPGLPVDDERAVADRPDARMFRKLQERVGDDPAALLPARERSYERIRPRRHGADQRPRRHALAAGEERRLRGGAVESRVEADLDAALDQQTLSEGREALRQLRQDQRPRVEQDDADLLCLDVAKALRRGAHEVV